MRCYICDETIPDDRVKINFITKKVEPCPRCYEEIRESVEELESIDAKTFD